VYNLETREIFISRDVIFCEHVYPDMNDPNVAGSENGPGYLPNPPMMLDDKYELMETRIGGPDDKRSLAEGSPVASRGVVCTLPAHLQIGPLP